MFPLHLEIPKHVPPYFTPYFSDRPHIASARHSPVPVDLDVLPSPLLTYHYANSSLVSPISPTEMYKDNSPTTTCPPYQNSYDSLPTSRETASYLSDSPSPVDLHPPSFLQTDSMVSSDDRHPVLPLTHPPDHFQTHTEGQTLSNPAPRNLAVDGPNITHPLLDHRRMSEPAILHSINPYASQSFEIQPSHRLQPSNFDNPSAIEIPRISGSAYIPSLQRGTSISSLRDLRHTRFTYSPPSPGHYSGSQLYESYTAQGGLDGPISPSQPNFGFGIDSPTAASRYLSTHENSYGSSPPGTGTSTSSAPLMSPTTPSFSSSAALAMRDSRGKTYSFVPLPGNNVKKRPRRRYDEIERLYQCSWGDCTKAYGTLNHLNAHVTMQKHGPKRHPNEFKELRKHWRKARKGAEMLSSEVMQQGLIVEGHDHQRLRRYETTDYSTSVYARQPSAGLSSSIPILSSGSSQKYPLLDGVGGRTIGEPGHHHSLRATPERQRIGGTPASWHGSSQSRLHEHLSSSLPSQTATHGNNISLPHLHNVTASHPSTSYHHSRPETAPVDPGRLPLDSTLFTPLPGYHPSTLSIRYGNEVFEAYQESLGQPVSGHNTADPESGDER